MSMGGGSSIALAGSRGFLTQTSVSSDRDSFAFDDQATPRIDFFCHTCASFSYRLIALGVSVPHICGRHHPVCQQSRVTVLEETTTLPEESRWLRTIVYEVTDIGEATIVPPKNEWGDFCGGRGGKWDLYFQRDASEESIIWPMCNWDFHMDNCMTTFEESRLVDIPGINP